MFEGGCTCKHVRYRVTAAPVIVHCCHCSWCQRESGTAFALNAVVESKHVELTANAPEMVDTPSASGKGQRIQRCPKCRVAVWSHYQGSGLVTSYMRVGTFDEPRRFPPDVHIYTSTKQPWVILPANSLIFPEFYNPKEVWKPEALARWAAAMRSPQ